MRYRKFKIVHLLLTILLVAFFLASFIEQKLIVGQSTTRSPDGKWCLDLKLVEYSTLFTSRKVLDAVVDHVINDDWDVSTSVPLDDADAETISNLNQDFPIVWSDDSSTVSYWINKRLEDSIMIEANDGEFKFQRDLYSLSVTHTHAKNRK